MQVLYIKYHNQISIPTNLRPNPGGSVPPSYTFSLFFLWIYNVSVYNLANGTNYCPGLKSIATSPLEKRGLFQLYFHYCSAARLAPPSFIKDSWASDYSAATKPITYRDPKVWDCEKKLAFFKLNYGEGKLSLAVKMRVKNMYSKSHYALSVIVKFQPLQI